MESCTSVVKGEDRVSPGERRTLSLVKLHLVVSKNVVRQRDEPLTSQQSGRGGPWDATSLPRLARKCTINWMERVSMQGPVSDWTTGEVGTAHSETPGVNRTRTKCCTSQSLVFGCFEDRRVPSASQSIPQPMSMESQSTISTRQLRKPMRPMKACNVPAADSQVPTLCHWLTAGANHIRNSQIFISSSRVAAAAHVLQVPAAASACMHRALSRLCRSAVSYEYPRLHVPFGPPKLVSHSPSSLPLPAHDATC